jgi:hypothetical protein
MAVAIPFITLAVGALSAVGQAQTQEQAADVAALNADRDRQIAEANADITSAQANAREEDVRREARQKLGASRAAIAQSGTGLLGSNSDIYSQQARDAEMDALNVRYSGNLERTGLLNQGQTAAINSQTYKQTGKSAMKTGYVKAGTSLLQGASDSNMFGLGGAGGR